jgi:hypothetical protein
MGPVVYMHLAALRCHSISQKPEVSLDLLEFVVAITRPSGFPFSLSIKKKFSLLHCNIGLI